MTTTAISGANSPCGMSFCGTLTGAQCAVLMKKEEKYKIKIANLIYCGTFKIF
jgi:hypothetical protein